MAAWRAAFEEWAEAFVAERDLPGMSVAVAEAGREVYVHGFGHADREAKTPVTPDTVYGIGSITKSFTCLAILQLVETGRLRLDAPIVACVPELRAVFGDRAEATTLHHLMTHSTGLPPLPTLTAGLRTSMEADPYAREELEKADRAVPLGAADTYGALIDLLARLPFPWLGDPGAQFSYSNDAYALLGLVIERAAGVAYERYVTEHILRPAGLGRTLFEADALPALGDVATLYARRPEPPTEAAAGKAGPPEGEARDPGRVQRSPAWWSAPAMSAAGFLKSTARDLLRYLEIYHGQGTAGGQVIVSPESVRRMTTAAIEFAPGQGYGYGLVSDRSRGPEIVHHSGGLKGISAFVLALPAERLSVSVLINLGGEAAPRVGMAVLNAMMGRDPAAEGPIPPETALPPDRQASTGRFYSGEALEELGVVSKRGGLFLVGDGTERRMQPVGDGYFLAGQPPDRLWLRTLERDGKAVALGVGSRVWPRRELWDAVGYPRLRPRPGQA